MTATQHLLLASAALALLTFAVGLRLLQVRLREMKSRRIAPQAVALSGQVASRLEDTRASDNYRHLFELPVLFYVLCALAVASGTIPELLPIAAWAFVALRVAHSLIQCSYNRVVHRFAVFLAGFFVLAGMWIGFGLAVI